MRDQTQRLSLDLLGGFRLRRGDDPIRLPTRKAAILVAALAVARNRSLSREYLSDLLWQEAGPDQARASLRQALSRIRQALGVNRESLEADIDTVCLSAEGWDIDIDGLEAAARASGSAGEVSFAWAEEFLSGIQVREAGIDIWLETERQRYRQLAYTVLARHMDEAVAQQDFANVIRFGLRLLTLDPLSEAAHRNLMQAYHASGERTKALNQFRTLRNLLQGELGVEPTAETVDLYNRIRDTRHRPPAPERPKAVVPPHENTAAPAIEQPPDLRLVVLAHFLWEAGTGLSDLAQALPRATVETATAIAREFAGAPVGETEETLVFAFGLHEGSEMDGVHALAAARQVLAHVEDPPSVGVTAGLVTSDLGQVRGGRVAGRAHRLAVMGQPGTILLDPVVRQLVGECARLSLEHKGQHQIWRLIDLDATRPRPRIPFVGRRMEVRQLTAILDHAPQEGGHLAILSGDAGVGKSRLVEEVSERAQAAGYTVVIERFQAFGNRTRAFRDDLARAIAWPDGAHRSGDLVERAVARAGPDAGALIGTMLEGGPDGPGQGGYMPDYEQNLDLTRDALLHLLTARAALSPVLLVIENCHWANAGQADLLVRLLDGLADLPVLMLATERLGEERFRPLVLSKRHETPVLSINLTPLRRSEARDLADRLLGSSGQWTDRIVERSAGNPLFLLRLVEAQEEMQGELPPTVIALVQQQLDRTSAQARAACHRAAILGTRFEPDDFRGVFPDVSEGDLLRSGFLNWPGDHIEFSHALIHEAVYATIPERVAASLHDRAARYYETRDPVLWAEHALRTGDSGSAARACASAAEAVLTQGRYSLAEKLIASGLDAGGPADETARLLLSRGRIRREKAEFDAAIGDFERVARTAHQADFRVQAQIRLCGLHKFRGNLKGAEDVLADAVRLAGIEKVSDQTRADLENERGDIAFVRGEPEICLQHHEAARRLAERANLTIQQAEALGGLGDAHYAALRLQSAKQRFRDCVAFAETHRLGAVANAHRHMAALAEFYVDPGDEAIAHARGAVEKAASARNLRNEVLARLILAEMAAFCGDTRTCADEIAAVDTITARIGTNRFDADHAFFRCLLLRLQDEESAARDLSREAFERYATPYLGPSFAGLFAAMTTDPDEQEAALEKGEALLSAGTVAHGWIHFLIFAAEAALRSGDADRARAYARRFEDLTGEEPIGIADRSVAWIRCLAGDGTPRDAVAERLRESGLSGLIRMTRDIGT